MKSNINGRALSWASISTYHCSNSSLATSTCLKSWKAVYPPRSFGISTTCCNSFMIVLRKWVILSVPTEIPIIFWKSSNGNLTKRVEISREFIFDRYMLKSLSSDNDILFFRISFNTFRFCTIAFSKSFLLFLAI